MPMKGDGTADPERIDEFDGGLSWLAYPDERMQRASHAVTDDGDVWILDPVDGPGVDEFVASLDGDVAGTVVCLDRHKRDAAAVADRHGVPVYVPEWMTGVAEELDAPVERFGDALGGFDAIAVKRGAVLPWQEVALYDETGGTLYVPEAVGTVDFMTVPGERLGVHPALRLLPPRRPLSGLDPDRVLVGHGAGVHDDAATALAEALRRSRRTAPELYARTAASMLS
ncbi:hypothetical protein [Halobaculum sp. P14]|uniref:hypothetical protein n=1 Tax=Halobaculum sp. P14 TaxID=3421638 RepID=UPI003EC0F5B1